MEFISSLELFYFVTIISWYFINFYFLLNLAKSNLIIFNKNVKYNWKSEIKAGISLLIIILLFFLVNPNNNNISLPSSLYLIFEELIIILCLISIILNIIFLLTSLFCILFRNDTYLEKKYLVMKKSLITLFMVLLFIFLYFSHIFPFIMFLEV